MPIFPINDSRSFTNYKPHSMYMTELYQKYNLSNHRDFINFMNTNTLEIPSEPQGCTTKTCPVCKEAVEWKP